MSKEIILTAGTAGALMVALAVGAKLGAVDYFEPYPQLITPLFCAGLFHLAGAAGQFYEDWAERKRAPR